MVGQLQCAAVHPALVGALDCQFEHADDGIHRGADFMADGGQERALGAVGIVGLLLGLTQLHDQLAALADVDPAADDALHFAQRVAVRQYPVIDGHFAALDPQWPVHDQRRACGHDLQVVGLDLPSLLFVGKQAAVQLFADDIVGAGLHSFQVAVVAALQAALAVTHVHGVGRAVEQGTHERQLVVQCPFGALALADLQAQAGVPEQGQQQQRDHAQHHL
ncbi:hypothetical protein D3C76_669190 [compost metagenome]